VPGRSERGRYGHQRFEAPGLDRRHVQSRNGLLGRTEARGGELLLEDVITDDKSVLLMPQYTRFSSERELRDEAYTAAVLQLFQGFTVQEGDLRGSDPQTIGLPADVQARGCEA